MSIGTEALKFYEECTGIKQRKPTKIVDHRTSGPKHGRAYQVMSRFWVEKARRKRQNKIVFN